MKLLINLGKNQQFIEFKNAIYPKENVFNNLQTQSKHLLYLLWISQRTFSFLKYKIYSLFIIRLLNLGHKNTFTKVLCVIKLFIKSVGVVMVNIIKIH